MNVSALLNYLNYPEHCSIRDKVLPKKMQELPNPGQVSTAEPYLVVKRKTKMEFILIENAPLKGFMEQ